MTNTATATIVSLEEFLIYWQGHRALTRRVIEVFAEDQLFTFSAAPPMRPFGVMAWEIHQVSELTLNGLLTGKWPEPDWREGVSKDRAELLKAWDALSGRLEREFLKVDLAFFPQTHTLPWGEMTGWAAAIYTIDNEIHHRGQGYVYLRALGIEPPAFYER
ncbi:damage-inducible protein DinB [Deinococcus sp. SDU3-2]|uniref:Damage-inducible protein DinB n=1 Tax=Deinococcus terrestris TaxID=2651870 RepID=A0A7X1NXZ9_9DEIO|nr:DinB family protein [Deinococcus terrestris]MPY67491.1 damage-inducible protein DinB [Deinococcus terrestris]